MPCQRDAIPTKFPTVKPARIPTTNIDSCNSSDAAYTEASQFSSGAPDALSYLKASQVTTVVKKG
jgi:hypothetical protein